MTDEHRRPSKRPLAASRIAATTCGLAVTGGLLLLAGCGGGGGAPDAAASGSSAERDPTESGSASDRCALLKHDEVEAAIIAHDGGTTSLEGGAVYGLNSCLWKATTPHEVEGYPDGYFDLIEVSVLEGDVAEYARGDAEAGAPVADFVDGALFDGNGGQLWFDCGDGQLCHVRVVTADVLTASGDTREEAAVQFGRLVLDRL